MIGFFGFDKVLWASLICCALSIYLTGRFLKRQGVGFERWFIGFGSMASGVWLYEFIYHYSYGHFDVIDLFSFTVNANAHGFPILWAFIMVSLPFSAYRYMSINRAFIATLAIGLVVFTLWLLCGYPQFFAESWYPSTVSFIRLPHCHIATFGYLFNSTTKILTLTPTLLFWKKSG